MDFYRNIRKIEKVLYNADCVVSDAELFAQFDDKAWFMGLFLGILDSGKLICAISNYCAIEEEITLYLDSIRSTFSKYGMVRRFALYRLSNGKVVAVQYNKRLNMRLEYMIGHDIHDYRLVKSNKEKTLVLNLFEEDSTAFTKKALHIGALIKIKDYYVIKPIYIFDQVKLDGRIILDTINLLSYHGILVSGEISFDQSKKRYIKVLKTPSKSIENTKIVFNNFALYEDAMKTLADSYHHNLTAKKVHIRDSHFIEAHNHIGNDINSDWFAREFGFFIKLKNQNAVYKFSPFPKADQNFILKLNIGEQQ